MRRLRHHQFPTTPATAPRGSEGLTITLGNGNNDTVAFAGSNSTITLGNGAGDVVKFGAATTITLGNGAGDVVNTVGSTIFLGDGAGDVVNVLGSIITVGNGNGDVVNSAGDNTITVGNGNDTIYVGSDDNITVGTGHDAFVFKQTTPGNIGAVTINHFDPGKDVITLSNNFKSTVSYQDDSHGNAVITIDTSAPSGPDTITLVGVHSAALHPSDFHFAWSLMLGAPFDHLVGAFDAQQGLYLPIP